LPRTIIHLDLDAFFCAVEEQHNPALRGKPFAVGGQPHERGVVSSCSYAARMHGVRSAMPMRTALGLCPQLLIVPPKHSSYAEASRQVMERLHQHTPLVEQISIDEAFLDVSHLGVEGREIAHRIQTQIRQELGLPCSLGVATNKLVAKIASDQGKASRRSSEPPNAITVVAPGSEAAFLAPLPPIALWGVGPKTAARLAELGINTIADLANWPVEELARLFGKHGYDLARQARGEDNSPIQTSHETKSISQETTFNKDTSDPAALKRTLRELSDSVGKRLQGEGLHGRTVKLKLRWHDFTTLSRQTTLAQPTDQGDVIFQAAEKLLNKIQSAGKPVRLLGVGLSSLDDHSQQLSLWDVPDERSQRLETVMDELRQRFGPQAVRRGIRSTRKT
jgi:DNA polymerase-4